VDGDFVDLKLTDYAGKYLILLFYSLDFAYVCPTEIMAFSDKISEFHAMNAEVVAISTESQFAHLAWTKISRKKGGIGQVNIPLLSDTTHKISKGI
jgi:peroxiredoxin (alkyl hydroperoxide reductase subunit C)